MSLKSHLAFSVFIVFSLLAVSLSAQELNVQFQTSPPVDLVRPQHDLVKLSVLVSDGAAGRPVESGWVDVRLDAPEPGGFVSTDIPLIEGTQLTEMRLPLKSGKAEWQYAWPIRGEYRLTVETTTVDGKRANNIFAIAIRESPTKWLALAGFSLGLFLFGFVAGRIFTAKAVSAAILLLPLLLFGSALPCAVAQVAQGPQRPAQTTLNIESAVVGKPARIVWRLGGDVSSESALLTIEIEQLEESHKVFAVEKLPVAGEFALNFQFVDGSEHRVMALAEIPGRAPIRIEQRVSVLAVEPPAATALPALAFFLFMIALGLGVGRWSKLGVATR